MGVSLQAFECHATVAIVLLVTFVLAGFDTLAGATFFLGHATLRMYECRTASGTIFSSIPPLQVLALRG